MRFYGIEMSISHTWEITHCGMLFWEDTFMVKRIISVVLAVAVIAGFAVVCSADKNTDDIGGKFSSHREYCYFNGVEGSNKVVLAAEAFKNNKSLGAKKQTWEDGNFLFYKEVTYYKSSSTKGYHVGYYMKNNSMYYNRGYDYES